MNDQRNDHFIRGQTGMLAFKRKGKLIKHEIAVINRDRNIITDKLFNPRMRGSRSEESQF